MPPSSGSTTTAALLWLLAATVTGYAVHSVGVLPTNVSVSTTIGLLVLGGVLYYLSVVFVAYYNGEDTRLT